MRALLRRWLLIVCALPALAAAQDDPRTLAQALVAAQAPATDGPDATARELLTAALAQPRSPVAALLVREAGRWLGQLQDPAALLALLPEAPTERRHGLLAQECAVLRWRLQRATNPARGERLPLAGHASSLLACGPFGDAGDSFVGVPFAPELDFPAAGASLPGRGWPARCVARPVPGDGTRIDLALPPERRQGCHYGRWRIAAAADADGFVEVDHDGDWQLFVDGAELGRLERWRATAPARHWLGVHLPAGGHELVVKTASNGRSSVGLRVVDGEGRPLPGLAEVADPAFQPGPPARATGAAFVTGESMLARLANEPGADAAVVVAAVLAAVRDGHGDLAIDLTELLPKDSRAEPALALAMGRVLRVVPLPDELRKARARTLEEPAAAALLPAHHTARLVQASHLEEQDQREDALRLLGSHPAPGPETFARSTELLRQLRFSGEVVAMLRTWIARCPRDARPLAQLANEQQASRDSATLLALRQRSLALRPDQVALATAACRDALALGAFDVAAGLIELAAPATGDGPSPGRLRLLLDLAVARGDATAIAAARAALADHPDADGNALLDLAAAAHRDGDQARSHELLERLRQRDGDRADRRAWLAATGGPILPIDELQPLRRDGRAAVLAFAATEREQGASTTLLIDQCILVMNPDGSWTAEVHQLRRINDQTGVESFAEKVGLAGVDEVLLVRTLSADGSESVPARIDGDYALPRLQPGAFVEWRQRQHGQAPGADPVASTEFLFGSADEPTLLAEFALVLPAGRGELRTRALGEPTGKQTLADGRAVSIWTRTDLAALAKERFLPSLFDLLPCAQVGEDHSPWPTFRDHRAQLGRRARATAPLRTTAARLIAGIAEPRAQADAIWTFVHEQIEDGNADSALDTLLRKKGNRFLLAIALLRAAGFAVTPLACAESAPAFGAGTTSLFGDSEPLQFPAALFELPGTAPLPLFLDTPRHWPLGAVPAQRAGSQAWVVRDDAAAPFLLPAHGQATQDLTVRGVATLRDRELLLTATIAIGDVAGLQLAERLRQMPENTRKLAARQITQQLFTGFRVEAARIGRSKPGEPLQFEVTVKRTGVQKSGDRQVVPLPLPATRFAASFGDREPRTLPWNLAVGMRLDWLVEFDAGPGLHLVAAPANTVLDCEPLHFHQHLVPGPRTLRCQRTITIGAATRPAATFGDWLRTLAAADRAEQATFELAADPAAGK